MNVGSVPVDCQGREQGHWHSPELPPLFSTTAPHRRRQGRRASRRGGPKAGGAEEGLKGAQESAGAPPGPLQWTPSPKAGGNNWGLKGAQGERKGSLRMDGLLGGSAV